jgi:hypothetical protein
MQIRIILSALIVPVLLLVISARSFRFQTALATNQQNKREISENHPVLWEEPTDLERRDLFYGIGGIRGVPDPSDKFVFRGRDTSGTAEKILVEDSRDRKWKVKFGLEPRAETTATRIVWAVGYHVDQDYFVKRTRVFRGDPFDIWDVRFERDDDGFKKVGRWDWNSNPFEGTRELGGLKTLMAFLNNFDLKTENNRTARAGKRRADDPNSLLYYVNDLGATLGSTGYWITDIPVVGELASGSKGVATHFAEHKFIDAVRDGEVRFHINRRRTKRALKGVKVEHARWMGEMLDRLSDKQIRDAFLAGGFTEQEIEIYARAIRNRIDQLLKLK